MEGIELEWIQIKADVLIYTVFPTVHLHFKRSRIKVLQVINSMICIKWHINPSLN